MREEFDEYARELRRAKDQEEFDRFMANRNRATAPVAAARPARSPAKGKGKDSPLED